MVLYRLKFQRRGFQIRRPLGQVERLDANDFFFFVVIENYAGRDFLRFNDLGVIQPQVKRVGFLVQISYFAFHFAIEEYTHDSVRFNCPIHGHSKALVRQIQEFAENSHDACIYTYYALVV